MRYKIPKYDSVLQALRKGRASPESLQMTAIEAGAQKTAYWYIVLKDGQKTKIVIKRNTGGYQNQNQKRPPDLTAYGCATIEQVIAGDWIVQELVTPLRTRNTCKVLVDKSHKAWSIMHLICRKEQGDYHEANFGIRSNGELVCFDW